MSSFPDGSILYSYINDVFITNILLSSRIGTVSDKKSGIPNTIKLLNRGVKYFLVPEEHNRSAITEVYETVTYSSKNSVFHVGYASRFLLFLVLAVVSTWNFF